MQDKPSHVENVEVIEPKTPPNKRRNHGTGEDRLPTLESMPQVYAMTGMPFALLKPAGMRKNLQVKLARL